MVTNGKSRLYETLFIVHPDQGGGVKELIQRFKKILEEQGGAVAHVEEWGLRDLAYLIQKQLKGYYVLLQYRSSSQAVEELERNMKLTDAVIRYLSVRVDEHTEARPRQADLSRRPGKSSEENLGKPTP